MTKTRNLTFINTFYTDLIDEKVNNPSQRQLLLKQVFHTLLIFSFSYLALYLVFSQIERIAGIIPISLGFQNILLSYLIGGILVLIIQLLVDKRGVCLKSAFILCLVSGSILINLYSIFIHYPPYVVTKTGNLNSLVEQRWRRTLPFDFFKTAGDLYLLQTVVVNPSIINFNSLKHINRYGMFLELSENVPAIINAQQFTLIDNLDQADFTIYHYAGIEYRFYHTAEVDNKILLTSYADKVVFIPISWIIE